MAAHRKVAEGIEMEEERMKEALAMAWKAQERPEQPFLLKKISSSPKSVIISFPASGVPRDWFSGTSFGETQINLNLFPSLRSVGNDEAAKVNEAFLNRFQDILERPAQRAKGSILKAKVEEAMAKKKQIVFTGHSSGAPVAILATLWALDKYVTLNITQNTNYIPPQCVTFGSPLVGDHIFSHATRRENWSRYFYYFVMSYDILPRALLAPLSSFEQRFDPILQFFDPRSRAFMRPMGENDLASDFYMAVMRNVATVTSHAACKLMGRPNESMETLINFINFSPYRPFGTYIFCTRTGKLIVLRNPDAVLQFMFFSAQLSTETEVVEISKRSLEENVFYGSEGFLNMQNAVYLNQLGDIPLSLDDSNGNSATINVALNDFGLSTRARLCLHAAGELEKLKTRNEAKLNGKKHDVKMKLEKLKEYRDAWEANKVGYFDAFKLQDKDIDFQANVKRLELAAVWDEIVEMLKNYELPDEFECNQDWIDLGTTLRRLVEPLDIANYYRHSRGAQSGPYMGRGRPRRYKYPQRWLEHSKRLPKRATSESTFWAQVEEFRGKRFQEVEQDIVQFEKDVKIWTDDQVLGRDVFLAGSTFVEWWKTLPVKHRKDSCIASLVKV